MIDPQILLGQVLKGREFDVQVGRWTFRVSRPTEYEIANAGGQVPLRQVQDKTVGWKGVLESDIVDGGASDELAFDKPLFIAWSADRADVMEAIFTAMKKEVEANRAKLEAVKGN